MDWSPVPWLQTQQETMVAQLVDWCNLNSGTENLTGIRAMQQKLKTAFEPLAAEFDEIEVPASERLNPLGIVEAQPIASALRWRKRTRSSKRVLLCIHCDTVYGKNDPFQSCSFQEDGTLNGPGVADAKGGLMVMLYGLLAFEQSPLAQRIGFEVVVNSDEEIGSPGTASYFKECAPQYQFGLLYEPTLPSGTMVDQRKGSGNFSLVVRGRAAHAGREFHLGRNAIVELARMLQAIDDINRQRPDLTMNVGRIEGGGAVNIVPDLAIAHLNARVESSETGEWLMKHLADLVSKANQKSAQAETSDSGDSKRLDGFEFELHGALTSPPKLPDTRIKALQTAIEQAGESLDQEIQWTSTGGTCDGNKLFAYGLPNVDTLGVRGGAIHSHQEFMLPESLVERAALTAKILHDYAAGAFQLPQFENEATVRK